MFSTHLFHPRNNHHLGGNGKASYMLRSSSLDFMPSYARLEFKPSYNSRLDLMSSNKT